jgi:hypothetical protein
MNNNQLIIANTVIRQDADGRYFLNDLHKASGNNQKDKPFEWLRNKGTQDLIAEIIKQEIPASDKINNLEPVKTVNSFTEEQGTYVIKELVYAYAMWISPVFHLHVIRAYDALITAKTPPAQVDLFTADVITISKDEYIDLLKAKLAHHNPPTKQPEPAPVKPIRRRRPWTEKAVQELRELYSEGLPYLEIAEKLGRTNSAIKFAVSNYVLRGAA